jgi:hypothetical protein
LEWFGEASRVELAGSFNGWQQYLLLEPDLTSEIPKPDGARYLASHFSASKLVPLDAIVDIINELLFYS